MFLCSHRPIKLRPKPGGSFLFWAIWARMVSHKFVRANWINWQNIGWPQLASAPKSALVGPSATLRAAETLGSDFQAPSFQGVGTKQCQERQGTKSPKTKNSFQVIYRYQSFTVFLRPRLKSNIRLNLSYDMLSTCSGTITICISTAERGRIFVKMRTKLHRLDDASNLVKTQLMGNWRPIGNQMVNNFRHCWVFLVLQFRPVS